MVAAFCFRRGGSVAASWCAELVRADAGAGAVAGAVVKMVRRRRAVVARTERMIVVEVLRWCVKVAEMKVAGA
ncbi:hypothetical protein DEO72_LG4g742 [Vigna unguiculata]|uniref:Uncharacterized protein n=1 Tax=Vigna unguiculata TaxID=3917 RepID=A0A4D6LMR0_VIGUN|nr:hypothetical protein DEO72_LG4g742 [Vigna unguiculata]